MIIVPKAVHRFKVMSIKIPMTFLSALAKMMLRFIWKHKEFWIIKTNLHNKVKQKHHNTRFQDMLQDSCKQNGVILAQKLFHATTTKESFTNKLKSVPEQRIVSLTKVLGEFYLHLTREKQDPFLTPYTQKGSKIWISGLKTSGKLQDTDMGKDSWRRFQKRR